MNAKPCRHDVANVLGCGAGVLPMPPARCVPRFMTMTTTISAIMPAAKAMRCIPRYPHSPCETAPAQSLVEPARLLWLFQAFGRCRCQSLTVRSDDPLNGAYHKPRLLSRRANPERRLT